MQRRSEFRSVARIEIDDHFDRKQEAAIRSNLIRIDNVRMASRDAMADCEGNAGWICLDVRERSELVVEKRLSDANVMAFVPCGEERFEIRRGRKWIIPPAPILGGYVLVRCALTAHAFQGLLSFKSVNGIVGGALKPWRVNDKIMRRFIAMYDDGSLGKMVADMRLKEGDAIFVKAGPWVGCEGVIVQMPKVSKSALQRHDCKVSIEMAGRKVDFIMPLAFIEKL